MSRFIGFTQGGRGEASRLGHASSGIRAQAQGWESGVKVYGSVDGEGRDVFQVIQTGGSNGASSDVELLRIVDGTVYLRRSAIVSAVVIEDAAVSGDESAVRAEIAAAQAEGREVSDGCARTIASWFHDGQASPGYAFVSTGAICDPATLWRDLADGYTGYGASERLALDMLGTYLVQTGAREAVTGWADRWAGAVA